MKLKLSWVTEQEVKLVLVPVAFMFMRIWGVIRCILELYRALHHQKRSGLKFLVYMQCLFVCLFVYLLWLFVYILIIPCLILRKYFSVGAIFRFLSYYFR